MRPRRDYRQDVSNVVDAALLGGALAFVSYFTTCWYYARRPRLLALIALRDSPPHRDTLLRPSLFFVGSVAAFLVGAKLTTNMPAIASALLLDEQLKALSGGLGSFLRVTAIWMLVPVVGALHATHWTRNNKRPLTLRQSLRLSLYLVGGFWSTMTVTSPLGAWLILSPSPASKATPLVLLVLAHIYYHVCSYRIWRMAGRFSGWHATISYWLTFLSWVSTLLVLNDVLSMVLDS